MRYDFVSYILRIYACLPFSLLGDRGFPALIKEAQRFKPKGKGREVLIYPLLLPKYPDCTIGC